MPQLPNRLYLRAAGKIHERLSICKPSPICTALVGMNWRRVHRHLRLLQQARLHSWPAAEKVCRLRLERATQELRTSLERILPERQSPRPISSVPEIYRDLVALENEFSEVSVDLEEREIKVTTEPLVLEDIELGPFGILLCWEQLPNGGIPYLVEALEPNPAASSDEVTHPHVQEKSLCEGEARPILELALLSGRLYEFFLVVAQTLRTYNPDSAYVSLSQWYGIPCHDCGSTVNEEDHFRCERCEALLCSECSACCTSCDRCCCAECTSNCSACGEVICNGCCLECEYCQQPHCERCLEYENCKTCQDKEDENLSDSNHTRATVLAPSMGQVGLPA